MNAEQNDFAVNTGAGESCATSVPRVRRPVPQYIVRDFGIVEYEPTWRAMQRFTDERGSDTPDEIWLLEHPPVFTLGMNASRDHVLAPGEIPVLGDMAQHFTIVIATAFKIGIQLSAPFLVFGLLFNLGLGVLSRLMPQMQVFFIGMPLTIILGLLLLLLVIGAMMGVFVNYIVGVLGELAPAG